MPQFDITTFSSQIFWFALCFITLYLAASKLILPRIAAIIAARAKIVNGDKLASKKLNSQLDELTSKTLKMRQEAGSYYQSKIDETLKKSAKKRDNVIEELKTKIDKMNKDSRTQLASFLENSKAQNLEAVQNLVKTIKIKILS